MFEARGLAAGATVGVLERATKPEPSAPSQLPMTTIIGMS